MKRIRLGCVMLLFVLLLTLMPCTAYAESDLFLDAERFLFGAWSAENAVLSVTEQGTVTLVIRGNAPVIVAKQVSEQAVEGNALRIVLKNDSYCNLLRVSYTCGGVTYEDQIALDRKSEKQDYFLYVEEAEAITELRLAFSGGAGGTVELFGVGVVSLYDDSVEQPGEITECSYHPDSRSVTVIGSVKHQVVTGAVGASVALYAFDRDEAVDGALLRDATPLAVSPVSVRFEFSVPADTFSLQFRQYIVALIGEDGSILHQYSPVFPGTRRASSARPSSYKGVYTEHVTAAVWTDAQVAVMDVYLDRMESASNNGILCVEDGQYFYVDRSYVRELDDAVAQYGDNGCRVYLRLLLSDGARESVFVGDLGEDAYLVLFAYARFLYERYGASGTGTVDGMIFGRAADSPTNDGPVSDLPLKTYTERYAAALYVVSEAIRRSGTTAELVVPLSDRYDHDAGVSFAGGYPSRLFIVSLCKTIGQRFGGCFSVSLLIESDAVPAALGGESDRISVDRLAEWESSLHLLSKKYKSLRAECAYCWAPSPDLSREETVAAYVYNYYSMLKSRVFAFLVAPDGVEDRETLRALFDAAKYVNTRVGWTENQRLASLIGEDAWQRLVHGLSETAVSERAIWVYEPSLSPSVSARGTYVLWDHTQGGNLSDWSVSADGADVAVKDVGKGRALSVTFDGTALCSGLFYDFRGKEVMDAVDMISVEIELTGVSGGTCDLVLELCGETDSCVVRTTLESGMSTTVYVSTFLMGRGEDGRNVRLLLSPIGESTDTYTVAVRRLVAHSSTLNDERLAAVVAEARKEAVEGAWDDLEPPRDDGARKRVIAAIACALGVSAIIILNLAKKSEE